jgi:integrase
VGWKATGEPIARRQRDKWVVRVDGIDTETGKHRPKQLGTFASRRAAEKAARDATVEGPSLDRSSVAATIERWLELRTDVSAKTRDQYRWASRHILAGLGSVRVSDLDRDDIVRWLSSLAESGLSPRSVQICRTVLKAALADAVEDGRLKRNPAQRVALPAKVAVGRDLEAWTPEEIERFVTEADRHRLGAVFRVAVFYGLRRSELLALKWDDLDSVNGTLTVDEGLVATDDGPVWTTGKNRRSRRTIPLDAKTVARLQAHRAQQRVERLAAGPKWTDLDLIAATGVGTPIEPRNYDRMLAAVITRAGVPRLSSHGLRHTAATHMVANATDVGELRAIADVLGHSTDMLLQIYAHALPHAGTVVAQRIEGRS